MWRKIFYVMLVLSVIGSISRGFNRFKNRMGSHSTSIHAEEHRKQIEEQKRQKAEMEARDLQETIPAMIAQIRKGDCDAALALWRSLQPSQQLMITGPKKNPELQTLKAGLAEAVRGALPGLVEGLKAGKVAPEQLEALLVIVQEKFGPSEQYWKLVHQVDWQRVKAAPQRVIIATNEPSLYGALRSVLEKQWPSNLAIQPIFGRPISNEEAKAAFALYELSATIENKLVRAGEEAIVIPGDITLRLTVTRKGPCRTTWDHLESISVHPGTPPGPESGWTPKVVRQFASETAAKVEQALTGLPAWKAGGAGAQGSLLEDGVLSRREAAAFYLSSPAQFDAEFTQALRTVNTTAGQQTLREIIVDLNLEKYAPWFASSLSYARAPEIDQSLELLEPRPFFGGYIPFARCLALSKSPRKPGAIPGMTAEEAIRVVYPVFMKYAVPKRGVFFAYPLQQAEASLAPDLWNLVLQEKDPAERRGLIHEGLSRRENAVLWWQKMFAAGLPGSSPELREEILRKIPQELPSSPEIAAPIIAFADQVSDTQFRDALTASVTAVLSDQFVRAKVNQMLPTLKNEAVRSKLAEASQEPSRKPGQ